MIKLNSAKTVAVDPKTKWIRINEFTPRGVKLQLINKQAGVALYARYNAADKFFTHYYPLPTFEDDTMTRQQLITMLELQDTLNMKVHPEWMTQNFKWTRAIMVEGVEALEHYGWKWWKKQEPDMAQVQLELVDIWHFILSYTLEHYRGDIAAAADALESAFEKGAPEYLKGDDLRKNLDMLIASAAMGEINFLAFMGLLHQTRLTDEALYAKYIGKNVLNSFRADHGYKAGTYIKMWNGAEDNETLAQLMVLKPNATPEELYAKLLKVYATVVA